MLSLEIGIGKENNKIVIKPYKTNITIKIWLIRQIYKWSVFKIV